MGDDGLIHALYHLFHALSQAESSDRIANLPIDGLPFTNAEGAPFGTVKHLVRGGDKSGAAFDIFRLGWFCGRVWELVIIDGAYLPHMHQKIDSEFFIFAGRGHLSRDAEWRAYQEKSRVLVGRGVAHGFITDPEFGPTVFLSIQSDPIRKIVVDPNTDAEKFEDDFVYVDDAFPLPSDLLAVRKEKLAARGRNNGGRVIGRR
jgi:mannose-6-phosphate isomerase-like protein (cupin superfamily)